MQSDKGGRLDQRTNVEVGDLCRALRSCGVLTTERLRELSGASHWPDHNYAAALKRGVSERRIRKLGDDLYELGEAELQLDQPAP